MCREFTLKVLQKQWELKDVTGVPDAAIVKSLPSVAEAVGKVLLRLAFV